MKHDGWWYDTAYKVLMWKFGKSVLSTIRCLYSSTNEIESVTLCGINRDICRLAKHLVTKKKGLVPSSFVARECDIEMLE